MEKLYTLNKKKRPGADFGSDHDLLIAKSRLKLKKVGKTTRSFRYELNQIPYDYTVKVKVTQSCLTLCDPMDYTVHGILQARILEWVAFPCFLQFQSEFGNKEFVL